MAVFCGGAVFKELDLGQNQVPFFLRGFMLS
jgi:hypothetical protein